MKMNNELVRCKRKVSRHLLTHVPMSVPTSKLGRACTHMHITHKHTLAHTV